MTGLQITVLLAGFLLCAFILLRRITTPVVKIRIAPPRPRFFSKATKRLCAEHASSTMKPGEMAILDSVNCDICTLTLRSK